MATQKGGEVTFRVLIYRIANSLTKKNCSSLKFLYNITTESKDSDMEGLEIMQELLAKEYFSPLHPEKLEECMTELKRQDMVNLVRKYKKSADYKTATKKVTKKDSFTRSKSSSDSGEKDPGHTLSLLLMHTSQTVGQSKFFLDAMTKDDEELPKRKVIAAALTDVKKDFDRLRRSLNKAISVLAQPESEVQAYLQPSKEEPELLPSPTESKPIPLPKPQGKPRPMTHSATQPNLSSFPTSMASEQEKQVPEYINSFAGDRKSEATPLSTAGGLNRQSCYANSTPHEVTSTAFSIPKCKSQHWKRPVRTAGHKKEEVFEMEDERIYDSPRNASEKYVEDLSTNDLHIYVNSYKK